MDTREIEKAKRERIDNQHYIDFRITKDELEQMIKVAESFNSEIIVFIKRKEITEYRNKLVLMFNQ